MSDELLAEVRFSCGRAYLSVAGVAVAMEGDRCRDGDMPNEVYPPIPAHEMEHASIGGESIRGMDPQVVRFFRGDNWTKEMLEYVATKINAHRAAELSRLRADCKRKDELLREACFYIGIDVSSRNLKDRITAALADSDTTKGGG